MKVVVQECENEGLESLLGQKVMLFCLNYIYEGTLVGVNATCVKLENPHITYETGAFTLKESKDSQALPSQFWYIQSNTIESFGVRK